jgi:beta-lactam-binding protein with PASTA domain/subtilisin family serine protease
MNKNGLFREICPLRGLGLAVLLLAAASSAWGQASVTGINQASSTRVGRTTFNYTYTINVTNGAPGLSNAVATVTSSAAATTIVQGSVALGTLAAGASVTSTNTFTLQQDRTVAFNPASLTWTVTGTPFEVVPNVAGATQAVATSTITGAGLVVGTVTTASSSTVPSGSVISQSPSAGASATPGSAVNLTVSTGPAPVAVPNVVGLTQAAATSAITSAGLVVGTVTTASNSTVPSGSVISQSPSAGASAAPGSAVNLTVSTGPAPVTVPNVVGLTQAAATSAITSAGLVVGTVTTASSSTVPSGSVISQSPTAGASAASGSAVNLTVSSGPAPVTVPNVVGLTQAAASSAITSAGLVVGTVTTASSSTVPSGSVISQSPTAGASAASGSAVNLTVSSGPAPVTVPNVVGLTQAAATSAISGAGLTVGAVMTINSATVPAGNVISQSPSSGTSASSGSLVNFAVSAGPASAITQPTIDPEIITAGSTTTFTVSSAINLPNVIATSVSAQLVDASGNVLGILTPLNDNGVNGDQVAGDGTYSGTFTLTQPPVGRVYLDVTAAQSGVAGNVTSAIGSIAVLPQGVPTGLYDEAIQTLDVDPVTGANIVPGEVLACFSDASDPTGAADAASASNLLNAALVGRFAGEDNCYQMLLAANTSATAVRQAIATLQGLPVVTIAEPDFVGQATQASSPDPSYELLNFNQAHQFSTGAGVTVAVVDTGVDYTVIPNVVKGPRLVAPESQDPQDDNGHGTAMAGIIAATAPGSQIYAVKSYDSNNRWKVPPVHWGIHYAANHLGVKVINFSGGGAFYSQLIAKEIGVATSLKNCVVVASAGNDYPKYEEIEFPAVLNQMFGLTPDQSALISVTAVTDAGSGQLHDTVWPLSAQNADLSAPGVNIQTTAATVLGGGDTTITGTSPAAAFVSGTAALVKSSYPQWTQQQVAAQVMNSLQPIYELDTSNELVPPAEQGTGGGRIDPVAALGAIRITHQGHDQSVSLSLTLRTGIQIVAGNSLTLGSFYSIFGDTTPCEARPSNSCVADQPAFQLAPGQYVLEIAEADDPPEDAFGTIQLTAPGLTFVSVQNSATGSIVNPTNAEYSLIGANGSLKFAYFTLQQAAQ